MLSEYFFQPATVAVAPGQKVTLHLSNMGGVRHNLQIASLSIDRNLDPGQRADVDLAIPPDAQGSIPFVCKFHTARGMKGALSVSG